MVSSPNAFIKIGPLINVQHFIYRSQPSPAMVPSIVAQVNQTETIDSHLLHQLQGNVGSQ